MNMKRNTAAFWTSFVSLTHCNWISLNEGDKT